VTLGEWLTSAQARLSAGMVEASRLEAQLLAANVLLVERVWVLAHPEADFPELAGESLLLRRLSGEPLAYILGWREFYGRRFSVRSGVLIPRQETEILVETALRLRSSVPERVLDVGTGSGILAITLKLERPGWEVAAVDISPIALEIASGNAMDLGANVEFIESDLFSQIQGLYDLIVSNPPYVGDEDPLPKEVKEFEPGSALFAGTDGLDVYKRLSYEAKPFLAPGGLMLLELGDGQLPEVQDLFENAGWEVVEAVHDLGLMPRVLAVKSLV
jgi:release factor glutamine methyltransferase